MTTKYYTLKELETMLNVGQRTLYSYLKADKLKAIKVGRKWLVTEEQLQEFLNNCQVN